MSAGNSETTYGWVAITLHWSVALTVFALAGLGLYMVELDYYDPWYRKVPDLHKSIGITLFVVMLLRIFWRTVNPAPRPVEGVAEWEEKIASIVHKLLYLLLIAIMLSGYLISTADGRAIELFGLLDIPAVITSIENQEDTAGLSTIPWPWHWLSLVGLPRNSRPETSLYQSGQNTAADAG